MRRVSQYWPRGNQILVPLLSVVDDDAARKSILSLHCCAGWRLGSTGYVDRSPVLEIVRELTNDRPTQKCRLSRSLRTSLPGLAASMTDRLTRWIGSVLRQRLHLTPYKTNGRFVLPVQNGTRLETLYERYGLHRRGKINLLWRVTWDVGITQRSRRPIPVIETHRDSAGQAYSSYPHVSMSTSYSIVKHQCTSLFSGEMERTNVSAGHDPIPTVVYPYR